MRYIWQHIQTIIKTYDGSLPLTHFLKSYFKKYPILGSRDRKIITEMAYCWYRCAKGFDDSMPFETRMHACLFMYSNNLKLIHPFLPEALVQRNLSSTQEKLNILNNYLLSQNDALKSIGTVFRLQNIFPFNIAFSTGIDKYSWLQSTLVQPRLFIRVRKQKDEVIRILQEANVTTEWINDTCLAMPNSTAVDKLLPDDCYVVQDASSQQAASFFMPKAKQKWWDCCSGAGGKSLYLQDKQPEISLTVSDIRESILSNLKERFKLYHHKLPKSVQLDSSDATQLTKQIGNERFDGIICDVPCTGSGTWARTPEQLYFFDPEEINRITQIQKTILLNAANYLAPGGTLYYITCSVFKQENEDIAESIMPKRLGLRLQQMELINGMDIKADSLFIAVFKKPD